MGRHAGWLTAASALARTREDDGPHLIYVPEAAFDVETFVADVDRTYTRLGRCVIATSEGIHDADGTPIAAKLAGEVEKDAHGNVQLSGTGALGDYLAQLIKDRLGKKLRVRADTFGYLQRSFAGCVSEVDQLEARAVARRAAELAVEGCAEGSMAIRRTSDAPYSVSYDRIELTDVAAKTRTLPEEFIVDGKDIAPSFHRYALPLVGELPETEQL
jgi:6-phosphofructokinase 1